jgi:hypothetical protein
LPSFPDWTGIVQTKRSLADRAKSSSLAESAASATLQKRRAVAAALPQLVLSGRRSTAGPDAPFRNA